MVKIKINDPALAATVEHLMSLCSIPLGDGGVLICDSPDSVEGGHGIIVLYSDSRYLRSRDHTVLTSVYGERYSSISCPFSFDHLCGTVRRLLASSGENSGSGTREISVTPNGTITYGGMSAHLSEREMELFVYLREHSNETVTREEIKNAVWKNETEFGTNIVDVYISYLRKKLAPLFGKGVILSERGRGYSLTLPKD